MSFGAEITDEDLVTFKRDGFLLKRGMYTPEEISLLHDISKGEQCAIHDDPVLILSSAHTQRRAVLARRAGFRFGTGRGRGQGAEQQLNALGETRKSEIYHFEKHGQALASPSIYDAILFGERMIKAIERLILDPVRAHTQTNSPLLASACLYLPAHGVRLSSLLPHLLHACEPAACASRPQDEPRHSGEHKAVTLHHRKFTMKDAESYLPPAQETELKSSGNWQGAADEDEGARKTDLFCAILYPKKIISPRQARDE